MHRRELLRFFTAAATSGILPRVAIAADDDLYDVGRFGNARVLHLTDTHAQLLPVHFREPNVNLGIGSMQGKPPHLVGRAFLDHFGIEAGGARAHAYTYLDYPDAAQRYGRMGGFAHIKTLVDRLRSEAGRLAFSSTAATYGREAALPMRCRARTWSKPRTCSVSKCSPHIGSSPMAKRRCGTI